MESVGSHLRQARLSLGLTLEQASAKTRISVRNLQAIEDDDLTRFSSAFFYRSFVKQFAEYLNLDHGRLVPAVQEMVSTIPEPLIPGQVPTPVTRTLEPRVAPIKVRRASNLRWLPSLASFVVMLTACSSFYSVWQNSRSNWRASIETYVKSFRPASRQAPVVALRPNLAQMAPAIPQPSPPTSQTAPAASPDTAAKTDSRPAANPVPSQTDTAFHVELSVVERTWLSIFSDGKQIFTGILEPAETKILEGHDIARIRTGNAGALSLVFNGRPIGTVGPRGQVRTVIFTKDNYEVLEPLPGLTLTRFNPTGG